jgi:hypothetical protein
MFIIVTLDARIEYLSKSIGGTMGLAKMLVEIDNEIAKLSQAKALLTDATAVKRKPGRPKATTAVAKPTKKKRNLSPEGRKRIAEAVRRRWAAQRKAA